jgi:hypothetical protein
MEDCRRAISEGGAERINQAVDQLNTARTNWQMSCTNRQALRPEAGVSRIDFDFRLKSRLRAK